MGNRGREKAAVGERSDRRHRDVVLQRERRSGADRSEPRQSAVRPQRRAVLDEGVTYEEFQRRVRRDRADLPARELDRAVAGQCNIAAQDSRCAESRAAGHVEQSLVGAGADENDLARIIERPPPRSGSIRR